MKFWKLTLLSICCFFAISATVLVASCEKDACTQLKCKNGSACTEGFCRCQTGYEGAECEIKTVNRFIGSYIGYNHCDALSPMLDTLDVYQVAEPNVVAFHLHNNYPSDVFQGVASGYDITVPDYTAGVSVRKVHAELSGKDITMFVERDFNTDNPGYKSVCTFNGSKK